MKKSTTAPASAAVHLVCADVILAGFHAIVAPEGLQYDVVIDVVGRLYRVQVKSTAKIAAGSKGAVYNFSTTRNHRPEIHGAKAAIRQYTDKEIDILACVALDIRQIAYFKVSGVFVSNLHLYPPGTPPWYRRGVPSRRLIDAHPLRDAL